MEDPLYYTIYKTTNLVNGKFYIGKHQTTDLNDSYVGSGTMLWKSIKKHGIENFKKEILFIFDTESEMNSKEKEILTIEFLEENKNNCYNMIPGGQGGFSHLNDGSDEHLKRCSVAGMKGMASLRNKEETDPDYAKYISEFRSEHLRKLFFTGKLDHVRRFAGKIHSENTKAKLSELAKLRISEKNSQYGTCWITDGFINKKIRKTDLDIWIERGYYKGRLCKPADMTVSTTEN